MKRGFAQKVSIALFSVESLWLMNSEQKHTTESQRTQRLHREIPDLELFVQSHEEKPPVACRAKLSGRALIFWG